MSNFAEVLWVYFADNTLVLNLENSSPLKNRNTFSTTVNMWQWHSKANWDHLSHWYKYYNLVKQVYFWFKNFHRQSQIRLRAGLVWVVSSVEEVKDRSTTALLFSMITECDKAPKVYTDRFFGFPFLGFSFALVWLSVGSWVIQYIINGPGSRL